MVIILTPGIFKLPGCDLSGTLIWRSHKDVSKKCELRNITALCLICKIPWQWNMLQWTTYYKNEIKYLQETPKNVNCKMNSLMMRGSTGGDAELHEMSKGKKIWEKNYKIFTPHYCCHSDLKWLTVYNNYKNLYLSWDQLLMHCILTTEEKI